MKAKKRKEKQQEASYREGVQAFHDLLPSDCNPYPPSGGDSKQRIFWFNGWYDEWRKLKYGPNPDEKGVTS